MTRCLTLLAPLYALTLACVGDDLDSSTGATTAETSTASASSTSASSTSAGTTSDVTADATTGPDSAYKRPCQEGDFICDDWGCESAPVVVGGECYKRCTPTEIGGVDSECDEPQRPYCSQVGRALGGDYDCNGCVHICISAPKNQCDAPIANC